MTRDQPRKLQLLSSSQMSPEKAVLNPWAHGHPGLGNGTDFTLGEFWYFMIANGIHHIRSAPFHPATNGQAECMVWTTKYSLWQLV